VTLTLAEPLTAAALGALILGERPGVLALGGVALVLGGLAALAAPRRFHARPVLVPS
jgi:drug/metabolite transporter, DME family